MVLETHKRRYIISEVCELDKNHCSKRAKQMVTKITDLNDDCLENLFFYLSLKDLANIARSNTRFANTANYVFKKIHVNTLIIFNPFASNGRIYNNFLNILDAFGDSITKLNVTFFHAQRYHKRNQQILHRINEKCSKHVRELTLSNFNRDMIISKPFVHLRKLLMNDSYFSDSMANFIQKSSNISRLEFNCVENVFNSTFVEQQVPLMEHFANYNQVITDSEVENLQRFRRFVNVNQQLTSLGIGDKELEMMFHYEEVRQQFFKTIHRKLPYPDQTSNIEYLLPFEPLYFGNMRHLSLSLGYSTDFLHCLRQRRILIKHLPVEQLDLYVAHFNIETFDFLIHCRHLRKLRLFVCEKMELMNLAHLISISVITPQLDELELYILYDENPKYSIIPDTIKEIIKLCGQINRIVIGFKITGQNHIKHLEDEKKIASRCQTDLYDELLMDFPNKWRMNFVAQNVEINQRQKSREPFFLCSILERQSQ